MPRRRTSHPTTTILTAEEWSEKCQLEGIHPKRWRAVTIWIVVFTIIVFWGVRNNRETARQGKQAHDAICVLKISLNDRVIASQAFLDTHPNGFDGISASDIQAGVTRDRTTLLSLGKVKC